MTVSTEDMIDHLLKLPVEDRIRIADVLLESLHPKMEPEDEAALIAEMERRRLAVLSGEMALVPVDEAFARIRAELGK